MIKNTLIKLQFETMTCVLYFKSEKIIGYFVGEAKFHYNKKNYLLLQPSSP